MTGFWVAFAACLAIDGDTLKCDGERVRLARIDAPEPREPGYDQAKDELRLLIEGERVLCKVQGREKYGRLLGWIVADGVVLNDRLVSEGLAVRYIECAP